MFQFRLRDRLLILGRQTKIMGVLNVTPDSFSDGGRYVDVGAAESGALRMEREGADLVDVGGESSRPGARPVPAREEIRRVRPVIRRLSRALKIPVSVDTCKAEVAQAALDEGASLVNDIRALGDRRMAKVIARSKAGVVLMHMRGRPRDMQKNPRYRDAVGEVAAFLGRAVDKAMDAGIGRERILVDPGFGFGKTLDHNLEILRELGRFRSLGCPILVGLSRKSFVGALAGACLPDRQACLPDRQAPVTDRLAGSLAAAAVAIQRGAHVLRVHDVKAHRQLAAVLDRAAG